MLNDDQLMRMRVPELMTNLRERNLRVIGRKSKLLARLTVALLVEREHVSEDDEEEDEEENDNEIDENNFLGLSDGRDGQDDGRVQDPTTGNHNNQEDREEDGVSA